MKKEFNFAEVEREFQFLRRQYRLGLITSEEYKKRLKQLRIKDYQGRCWTLGARSGKWYYYNGHQWVEAQPPSLSQGKAICIYCGFENDLSNEVCAFCGSEINPEGEGDSNLASLEVNEKIGEGEYPERNWSETQEKPLIQETQSYVIKRIDLLSFAFFWGIIGTIVGMVVGILIGVMNLPLSFVARFPSFFQGIQGNLYGGILFGLSGAVVGWLAFGLLGGVGAAIFNFSLALMGGLQIKGKAS
ncbi:MAG: hypothetical protein J7L26_08690 [Candidatus Aminicenantes bacterium]|nr:hypothetical protein [Candidatus Aminicenantes bacterium]